jgi:hypothetical protein
MSTLVDVEEIKSTRSEKLLAVVLAVFLLIGGIWTYQRIDDYVRDTIGSSPVQLEPAERADLQRLAGAQQRLGQMEQAVLLARDRLELSREAYRTALDEGRSAPALERDYQAAQTDFDLRQTERDDAQDAVAAARPAAAKAQEKENRALQKREDRRSLATFVFRLLFVLAFMAVAYWLLDRLRKRNSRYLLLTLALVGSAAVLALVMAADYVTDYVDPLDLGPLLLSLFGIALTLAAFVALQRHLARRIPERRVRKNECPFCGYPVHENEHCEGCGHQVIEDCGNCARSRRVGALHCGACGHA